ncbi:MAG: hypothetical protein IIB56_07035 [Planctomycetes bacterium]|nr:hypothetical protein [Planctomycetota bacterium]MCH8118217.1 hypothetical protein [Planctomycetota bacterium]
MRIAIHPDDYTNPKTGKPDASSPLWAELLEKAGHKVKWVNVYRADILDQLKGCDGFMWRWAHFGGMGQIARRLLPVIENELGLEVYPDQATCWHYDDKIAQYYLLTAAGIPMPKTWVWSDKEQANKWLNEAPFPLVIKLWTGASSENVRLVRDHDEAKLWVDRLFGPGVGHLNETALIPPPCIYKRLRTAARVIFKGKYPLRPWELHKNYIYSQEFLPANDFDTRITVIRNRAFGFRRFNRPEDFRASGSGNIDYDVSKVDPECVRLGFRIARRLGTQSVACDFLQLNQKPVVTEISYTYASWAIYDCPGYWELEGEDLVWKAGHMWPEEAQIEDFLARLEKRQQSKRN